MGHKNFNMKNLKKKTLLDIYIKNLNKIPKKPCEKVVDHLQMLHLCKILHKKNLQVLETMLFFFQFYVVRMLTTNIPRVI
jgi:hypothetical protein